MLYCITQHTYKQCTLSGGIFFICLSKVFSIATLESPRVSLTLSSVSGVV